ncbi:MAG: RNA methyltransferase [archaeon YNP-WB-062]|nr:RNA methyltransferase [Candidatus Culexarchaeum yellowstonense]
MMFEDLMLPLRTRPRITIAIPSSFVSEVFDLRERTRKIGYVGRAAAIFRIEEIMIYVDDFLENAKFIADILNYLEIPPYLRRKLVSINRNLKHVGLLPPLKSVHHIPQEFNVNIREGVVIASNEMRSVVYAGLDRNVVVHKPLALGKRVSVEIERALSGQYLGRVVDKSSIKWYWGYEVRIFNNIEELLKNLKSNGYSILCASKKGNMIYYVEEKLSKMLKSLEKLSIIFGGPKLDIDEIAEKYGVNIQEYCDIMANFIPRQGVESVRTEEAIFIVLSIINYFREKK